MKGYLKFYKDLPWILRLIFAIIPITAWINAVCYRLAKGHIIAGVLCIFFGFNIVWVIDLISVILCGKPVVFAN